MPTIAVGLITHPEQAETIIASGEADGCRSPARCSTTRAGLGMRPRKLGARRRRAANQYWRSQPREYKDLFENAAFGAR